MMSIARKDPPEGERHDERVRLKTDVSVMRLTVWYTTFALSLSKGER